MTQPETNATPAVPAEDKARLTAEILARLKPREHNSVAAAFGFFLTSQFAWMAAAVCLALSAGDAYGRGMGFLVGGVLAAATSAVRASRQ